MRRALLAIALAGCTVPAAPLSELTRDPLAHTVHGDTRFAERERHDWLATTDAYRQLSNGRVRITTVWDFSSLTFLDTDPPVLYRFEYDAGNFGGKVDGGLMRVVPADCPDLRACMMHELGHYLGLEHVREAGQVMSASNPARRFGPADYRECVRVGVCRALRPDTTTVTLTVDSDVPPVEANYPVWSRP